MGDYAAVKIFTVLKNSLKNYVISLLGTEEVVKTTIFGSPTVLLLKQKKLLIKRRLDMGKNVIIL